LGVDFEFALELWSEEILKTIGNSLDKFIAVEEKFQQQYEKQVVKVLVEPDISKGILENIELEWSLGSFNQTLDYWKIPFSFSCYCEVGHLCHDCKKFKINIARKLWIKYEINSLVKETKWRKCHWILLI
jgi:hypothetical protein